MCRKTELTFSFVVFSMLMLLLGGGCGKKAEQPALRNPIATPATLNPAEDRELFASVEVSDPKGKIASIELSSPDVPGMIFTLNDKGEEGDKQAGDGIWSIRIHLPPPEQVPAGEFHLEFKAIGKDDLPIMVKSPEGVKETLKAESMLKIVSPTSG